MTNFLLFFLLLLATAHAQTEFPASCYDEDGNFNPECWTDPTCKRPGEKIESGQNCCQGLAPNAEAICDEPALTDPALVTCPTTGCTGGTGCFSQKGGDLFSIVSPNTGDPNVLSDKRDIVQAQMSDADVNKPAGGSCVHARDCESYSCVAGKCEDRKICRYAGLGEMAGASINCGTGLEKQPDGSCDLSADAKNLVYPDLIDDTTLRTVGQCRIELPDATMEKAKVALSSLRAMEWFFSTIGVPEEEECFKVLPILKDQVGKTLVTSRKEILKNFSTELTKIEFDYKQLLEAKKDGTQMLTIHGGEQIKEGDLYTRRTSGYDSLVIMKRRNLLFQTLETTMKGVVTGVSDGITDLSTGMASWKDGDTSWKIGDQTISAYNCEGSKYKKKKFLGSWKTKYYKKIKDRWAVHYEVTGSAAGNADIVKREYVSKNLGLIGGVTPEEAITKFTASKFYMIDPMTFGGVKSTSYGTEKKLKKKSSFLGLFGGFKDLRKARYINGSGSGSFSAMHSALKPKYNEFMKKMKLDPAQRNFVYEPELVTTEAKDCLDNPEKPEKCADFQPFMDRVLDESFAQFLAYSHHTKDDYSGFFPNAMTYRRKLLAKLEVDLQNLVIYYDATAKLREEQNKCIDKVIGAIIEDGILVPGTGGIVEDDHGPEVGPNTNPTPLTPGNITQLPSGSSLLPGGSVNPLDRADFTFDLLGTGVNTLSTGTNGTSFTPSANSTTQSASLIGSASGQMAVRAKAIRNANAKAKAAGVDVASKQNKMNAIIDSMGYASGGGGMSSGLGSDSMKGFGNSSFKGLDGVVGEGDGKAGQTAALDPSKVNPAKKDEFGTTPKINEMGGAAGGYGAGYGADSAGAQGGANAGANGDKSAMSDADKDWVMDAYNRNSSEYSSSEEDELFERVSKAYVRNLGRILNRKKELE